MVQPTIWFRVFCVVVFWFLILSGRMQFSHTIVPADPVYVPITHHWFDYWLAGLVGFIGWIISADFE